MNDLIKLQKMFFNLHIVSEKKAMLIFGDCRNAKVGCHFRQLARLVDEHDDFVGRSLHGHASCRKPTQ
jgi:hypothetical protein